MQNRHARLLQQRSHTPEPRRTVCVCRTWPATEHCLDAQQAPATSRAEPAARPVESPDDALLAPPGVRPYPPLERHWSPDENAAARCRQGEASRGYAAGRRAHLWRQQSQGFRSLVSRCEGRHRHLLHLRRLLQHQHLRRQLNSETMSPSHQNLHEICQNQGFTARRLSPGIASRTTCLIGRIQMLRHKLCVTPVRGCLGTSAEKMTVSLTKKPASWSNKLVSVTNSRHPQSFAAREYLQRPSHLLRYLP